MPLDNCLPISVGIRALRDAHEADRSAAVVKVAEDRKAALIPWLEAMSDPESRAFECDAYIIINAKIDGEKWEWPVVKAALESTIGEYRHRADDPNRANDPGWKIACMRIAYGALYVLCTKARRENRIDQCIEALEAYRDVGGDRATYYHLWAMALSSRRNDRDLEDALKSAKKAREKLKGQPRHIGVDHNYAEIVAFLAEEGKIGVAEADDREDIDGALRLAEGAVDSQPEYAKFHATVGRLKAVAGNLAKAEESVLKALRLEFDNWDSPARRIEYRSILTRIQLGRQRETIKAEMKTLMAKEMEDARKEAEESKIKHIEILGVFASVLALVLAGMAGLFSQKPGTPARTVAYAAGTSVLLMMLGGTILFVFGGLGATVHGRPKGPIIAMCLGMALFGLAWLVSWMVAELPANASPGWPVSFGGPRLYTLPSGTDN